MSREDYEVFKLLRKERMQDGGARRESNALLYGQAQQKASQAGMILEQHTDVHYSLQSQTYGWRLNIYPGNRRLYHDRQHKKPPFLKVPPDWNLLDVIDAAIAASNTTDSFEKEIAANIKPVTNEQIGERAYFLWEQANRPEGDGQQFWLAAEKELRG